MVPKVPPERGWEAKVRPVEGTAWIALEALHPLTLTSLCVRSADKTNVCCVGSSVGRTPLGSLLLRFLASLESPCRLLPVPAAHGSFPTLFPRTFPWMLDPLPRRYTVCSHLFLPRCHRPSPSD